MSKHTPTPWHTMHNKLESSICGEGQFVARVDGSETQTREEGEANADHIVKCVNAHDELVAALRDVLADSDAGNGETPKTSRWPGAHAVLAKLEPLTFKPPRPPVSVVVSR